jgi:hypothetical protein
MICDPCHRGNAQSCWQQISQQEHARENRLLMEDLSAARTDLWKLVRCMCTLPQWRKWLTFCLPQRSAPRETEVQLQWSLQSNSDAEATREISPIPLKSSRPNESGTNIAATLEEQMRQLHRNGADDRVRHLQQDKGAPEAKL